MQAVIHAFNFAQARRVYRLNLVTLGMRQGNDVGDIEFTLGIIIVQLAQPALQIAAVGHQNAGVDLINLALLIAGIFMFDNAHHGAVFTYDAAITARVLQLHRQQANATLRFGCQQARQRLDGDQWHIAIQHQHVFIIGKMRSRLLHRMAGSQLLSL